MSKTVFEFPSSDGRTNIRAVKYVPENREIKAVVQISHGMVEFIDRYEEFAQFLNERGILVAGNDHLGHGGSIVYEDDYGYFSKNDGYLNVLKDLHELTLLIKKDYPDVPYFLLGHSMGSFYARRYLFTYPEELDGAIIMGTGYKSSIITGSTKTVCSIIRAFKGDRYRSDFVNQLALGSYNKRWEPSKTHNDWLTKDERIVEWYSNEPKCSFVFTVNGFYNLFSVLSDVCKLDNMKKMNKDLPVYFMAGKDDPVGDYSKGVLKVISMFRKAGMRNVSFKIYENDRHELLNETDKLQVMNDIYDFLKKNM